MLSTNFDTLSNPSNLFRFLQANKILMGNRDLPVIGGQRQARFVGLNYKYAVATTGNNENNSFSYLNNTDSQAWGSIKSIRNKEKNKRLISILAFFIIFAMCFVIMYTLRMSDMIDEKGKDRKNLRTFFSE